MTDKRIQIKRLWELITPEWATLTFGIVALIGAVATNLLIPSVVRWILDADQGLSVVDQPFRIAGMLLAIFGVQSLCFHYRSFFFGLLGQRVIARLRRNVFEHLIYRELAFFDANRVSDLVSRLGSDAQMLQDAISARISVLLRYSLQVVIGLVLMTWISLQLTLLLLVALPLLMAIARFLGKRLRAHSKKQQEALGRASVIAEEAGSNARIVKVFGQEEHEARRYSDAVMEVLGHGTRRVRVSAALQSIVTFLMNASILVVVLYGARLVMNDALSVGALTAFLLYAVIVAVSFAFVASSYAEMLQALGATERIFELIEESRTAPTHTGQKDLPASRSGHLEFRNVTFFYPSRPDVAVLNDLSFAVLQGQTTALVGPSGAGKSTIVNLILGLYPVEIGEILVDGITISDIRIESLRSRIAFVPQEPYLFAVSIAENLRYGKPRATDQELSNICERARISEFIHSLPDGLDTIVGERGTQLSGGQRQRVAIARAMLRDPALLILDEATSSLDSQNEALVQSALTDLMQDRTTIVIAHRLSTVQNADQVLVLEHGRLVQTGTHSGLSRTEGLYRSLVEVQELRS